MHFNAFVAQMVAEERTKDARREVEQDRLEQLARPSRRRILDRGLVSFGGLLISTGKKMQGRHVPVQGSLKGSPSPAGQ